MWSSGLFASFQICLQSLVARSPFCALIMIHVLWSHSVNWVVRDCQKRFRGLVPIFFFSFLTALCYSWCLLPMCSCYCWRLCPQLSPFWFPIHTLPYLPLSKWSCDSKFIVFKNKKKKYYIWLNETLCSTGRAGILPFHHKIILQRSCRGFVSVWHYKVRILTGLQWYVLVEFCYGVLVWFGFLCRYC